MADVVAFVNTAMVAVEQVGKDNTTGKNGVSKLFLAMIRESMTQVANYKQEEFKKLQDQVVGQGVKISELTKDKNKLIKDNEDKDKLILDLQNDKVELQNQTDASNQYVRRDNFKITGVPYREDENLIEVVQSVTRHIGREIAESEISDIHRLPNNQTDTNGSSAPGIIIRVNRRRVKHEIMDKKKHLRSSPHRDYPNIGIYEDLTPLRSRILYALRNKKNQDGNKTYKFTWSKEGTIFCRTEQQTRSSGSGNKLPKPGIVNKPSDLLKLGFTEKEVNEIIINKRK